MPLFYHLSLLLDSLTLCHSCSFTKLNWLSFFCSTCPKGNTIADVSWWELSSIGLWLPALPIPSSGSSFGSHRILMQPELASDGSTHSHTCHFYTRPLPSWSFKFPSVPRHLEERNLLTTLAPSVPRKQEVEKREAFVNQPYSRQRWLYDFSGAPSAWKVGTRPASLRSAVHSLSQRLSVTELVEKIPLRPCWG